MSTWSRAAMYVLLADGVWIGLLVPVLANNQTGDWWPGWRDPALFVVGVVLLLGGLALSVIASRELITRGRGTPLPMRPPQHLVQSGPYAGIRNPMAVGFFAATLGAAVAVDATHVFLLPAIAVGYVLLIQLPPERRHLAEKHGDAYDAYCSRVPAWLPSRLTSSP